MLRIFTKTIPRFNTNRIKKIVNIVREPPAPSYRWYKLFVWSSLAWGGLFTTGVIGSFVYFQYSAWRLAKQDQLDRLEFEAEMKSITKLTQDEGQQRNGGIINTTLRISYLAILFVPLFFLYPLCFWNNSLYRDVWCQSFLFCLQMAGPCFIKMGQWIGTRRDLFSNALIEKCSQLHSSGSEHSFAETKDMIESVYKAPLENIFESFNPSILASGSIAQIHTGTLHENPNQLVVIKVRHPGVEYEISRDLYILKQMTRFINWSFPSFAFINLNEVFETFTHDMYAQTNLILEAENLIKFKHNFKRFDEIIFPRVITSLPLHPAILIETLEGGTPLSSQLQHLQDLTTPQKNKIAQLGTCMFLKMMLVDNFLHADLHPGNILLRIVNGEPRLTVLDAGLVSVLSTRDKRNFLDLFSLIAQGDGLGAAEIMVMRSRNVERLRSQPEKIEMFTFEMSKLINQVVETPLASLQVGSILASVLEIGRKYQVVIETNFTTLVIGTIVVEGLAKTLNPNFEFIKTARPFLQQDKTLRDAFITSQLTQVLKKKDWRQRIQDWIDLF